MIAQVLEDAADYAVLAGMNLYAGLVAVSVGGIGDGISMDFAVFKFYAVSYGLHILFGNILVSPDMVDFLLNVLRMCELGGQLSVVSEQKYASSHSVKTTHRVDALIACTFNQVHDSFTVLGVVTGGHAVLGFVEQDIAFLFQSHDLAVIFYDIAIFDFGTKLGYWFTVNSNQALRNEFIGFAARTNSGIGHIFVQPQFIVRAHDRLLILHWLGFRNKTLAT